MTVAELIELLENVPSELEITSTDGKHLLGLFIGRGINQEVVVMIKTS